MTDQVKPLGQILPCPGWTVTPEELAEYFHQEYERMAPEFGYKTRKASAVPWTDVPEDNRRLMQAVALSVLLKWFPKHAAVSGVPPRGHEVIYGPDTTT